MKFEDAYKCMGLPTEGALIAQANKLSKKNNFNPSDYETLFTISFSSIRKRMDTLVKHVPTGKNLLLTKGSGEILLSKC